MEVFFGLLVIWNGVSRVTRWDLSSVVILGSAIAVLLRGLANADVLRVKRLNPDSFWVSFLAPWPLSLASMRLTTTRRRRALRQMPVEVVQEGDAPKYVLDAGAPEPRFKKE